MSADFFQKNSRNSGHALQPHFRRLFSWLAIASYLLCTHGWQTLIARLWRWLSSGFLCTPFNTQLTRLLLTCSHFQNEYQITSMLPAVHQWTKSYSSQRLSSGVSVHSLQDSAPAALAMPCNNSCTVRFLTPSNCPSAWSSLSLNWSHPLSSTFGSRLRNHANPRTMI